MTNYTLIDDHTGDKPLQTRSHALTALGNLRAALTSEGHEPEGIDAAYAALVLAKDDLQAAITDVKAERNASASNRNQLKLEFSLTVPDGVTVSLGSREPVGAGT